MSPLIIRQAKCYNFCLLDSALPGAELSKPREKMTPFCLEAHAASALLLGTFERG